VYKQQALFKTVREASPEYFAQITQNPWDNVYWFARMLIASDKYGGVGTDTTTMLQIATSASKHPGMRDYVRPMSAFVADLAKEVR